MTAATLCYLRRNGEILMLFHPKSSKWNVPGGKVEDGETPYEAVIREVVEETGLTVSHPRFRGTIVFPNAATTGDNLIVFVYDAHAWTGDLTVHVETPAAWVRDAEFLSRDVWPSDHTFVPWVLEREDTFTVAFQTGEHGEQSVRFCAFHPR